MNAYEKIIKRMRSEGSGTSYGQLYFGEVLAGKKIGIGSIKLDTDLYEMLDSVDKISKGDTVLIAEVNDGDYVVLGKVK